MTDSRPDPSDHLTVIRINAAAEEVGVAVTDLVKLRRKLGTATRHRRPSRWTRLFRKG